MHANRLPGPDELKTPMEKARMASELEAAEYKAHFRAVAAVPNPAEALEDERRIGREVVEQAVEAMQGLARRRGVDADTLHLLALEATYAVRSLFRVDPWRER